MSPCGISSSAKVVSTYARRGLALALDEAISVEPECHPRLRHNTNAY